MPFSAPLPVPTIIATGVARPKAQGQEITKTNLTGSVALVIGSEGFGVSALTEKLCDGVVSLKLNGKVNSLNASVACGIAVYEVVRQRG